MLATELTQLRAEVSELRNELSAALTEKGELEEALGLMEKNSSAQVAELQVRHWAGCHGATWTAARHSTWAAAATCHPVVSSTSQATFLSACRLLGAVYWQSLL